MPEKTGPSRYIAQSHRYEDLALRRLRQGEWSNVAELLWGSLSAAVKAVAAQRGVALGTAEAMRAYAKSIARETGDPRIGEAFSYVDQFSESMSTISETRFMLDHVYLAIEEITRAIERFRSLVEPPAPPRRRMRE